MVSLRTVNLGLPMLVVLMAIYGLPSASSITRTDEGMLNNALPNFFLNVL